MLPDTGVGAEDQGALDGSLRQPWPSCLRLLYVLPTEVERPVLVRNIIFLASSGGEAVWSARHGGMDRLGRRLADRQLSQTWFIFGKPILIMFAFKF